MGFLDRLFGGGGSKKEEPTDDGIYIYARCNNCDRVVHTRLDPEHDLHPDGGGFSRRKTLIDDRCFRRMPMTATFDSKKRLIDVTVEGGTPIDRETWEAERDLPRRPPGPPASGEWDDSA